jgi:hypothetical protein
MDVCGQLVLGVAREEPAQLVGELDLSATPPTEAQVLLDRCPL